MERAIIKRCDRCGDWIDPQDVNRLSLESWQNDRYRALSRHYLCGECADEFALELEELLS